MQWIIYKIMLRFLNILQCNNVHHFFLKIVVRKNDFNEISMVINGYRKSPSITENTQILHNLFLRDLHLEGPNYVNTHVVGYFKLMSMGIFCIFWVNLTNFYWSKVISCYWLDFRSKKSFKNVSFQNPFAILNIINSDKKNNTFGYSIK